MAAALKACASVVLVGVAACSTPPERVEAATRPDLAVPAARHARTPAADGSDRGALRRTIPRASSLAQQLESHSIGHVSFTAGTGDYLEVCKLLRAMTGVPIVVTPQARATIAGEGLRLDMEIRAPISLADILDLMVAPSDNLAWTTQSGVVLLTTPAKARGQLRLVSHDVRDLTFARTEFLPPVIRDIPNGQDVGTRRSGGEADEKVSAFEPDQLIQLVKMATDPRYWETVDGVSIDDTASGYLLVKADTEMQLRVARVLDGMR